MRLEVRFFATFREAVGQKTLEAAYPDDGTVGDVLHALEDEYEGLAGQLVTDGAVRPQINVLKNGREVIHMDGLDTDLADGDTLSIFPPVAGGDPRMRVERSFRGISDRLARHYLEGLGGDVVTDERVEGDDWTATLDVGEVSVGPTLVLTEVTITFEGEEPALEDLVKRFAQKAMRAGG